MLGGLSDPPYGGVTAWWAFSKVESGPRQLPEEGLEMELPVPFHSSGAPRMGAKGWGDFQPKQ